MKINSKINLILIIFSIFLIIFLYYFETNWSKKFALDIEEDYQYFINSAFKNYIGKIKEGLDLSDFNEIQEQIKGLKENQRIEAINIFSIDGTIISSSDGNIIGMKISDKVLQEASSKLEQPIIQYDKEKPKFIYGFSKNRSKEFLGGLEADLSISNIEVLKDVQNYRLIIYIAISFLVLIIMNFIAIKYYLENKLHFFIQQLQELSKEKILGRKLPNIDGAEFNEISLLINEMIANYSNVENNYLKTVESIKLSMNQLEKDTKKIAERIKEQAVVTDEVSSLAQKLMLSNQSISENIKALSNSSEETSAFLIQIQASVEELAGYSGSLANYMESNSASINKIAKSINDVRESLDELSSAISETVASTSEMDYAIKQVDASTKDASNLALNTMKSAETGSEFVNQTIESIANIKKAMEETSNSIDLLIEKTEEVSKILMVIKDITEQTNLLSLNASILAAQAGEYGKSFAVVANEIKNLADKTASSTKEIKNLINQIQVYSHETRKAMNASVESIDLGIQISSKAGYSLKEILQNVKSLTSIVQSISNATGEQSRGSKQITEAMERVAEMTHKISNNAQALTAASKEIESSTNEVKILSSKLRSILVDQSKGSKEVVSKVESIASFVGAINETSLRQRDNLEKMLKLIGNIVELINIFQGDYDNIAKTVQLFDSDKIEMPT